MYTSKRWRPTTLLQWDLQLNKLWNEKKINKRKSEKSLKVDLTDKLHITVVGYSPCCCVTALLATVNCCYLALCWFIKRSWHKKLILLSHFMFVHFCSFFPFIFVVSDPLKMAGGRPGGTTGNSQVFFNSHQTEMMLFLQNCVWMLKDCHIYCNLVLRGWTPLN